jgi:hypothetical protein
MAITKEVIAGQPELKSIPSRRSRLRLRRRLPRFVRKILMSMFRAKKSIGSCKVSTPRTRSGTSLERNLTPTIDDLGLDRGLRDQLKEYGYDTPERLFSALVAGPDDWTPLLSDYSLTVNELLRRLREVLPPSVLKELSASGRDYPAEGLRARKQA